MLSYFILFLCVLLPTRSTRTDTLFPFTTLFRSKACGIESDYLGKTSRRPGKMDGANVVGWARGTPRQPRALTLGKAHAGRLIERDIAFNSGQDRKSTRLNSSH